MFYFTYIEDFRQVMPSRLLTPEETLKISDTNQKKLTASLDSEGGYDIDIWRVVAVTLEKNVAIVVIWICRVVSLSFSSARNVGSASGAVR